MGKGRAVRDAGEAVCSMPGEAGHLPLILEADSLVVGKGVGCKTPSSDPFGEIRPLRPPIFGSVATQDRVRGNSPAN